MDSETQDTLVEGERAKRLLENEDWLWAKRKLEEITDAILSLDTLPNYKTAGALQNEIITRKKASGLVRAWIEEVEGSGTQQKYNQLINNNEPSYIKRFEETK